MTFLIDKVGDELIIRTADGSRELRSFPNTPETESIALRLLNDLTASVEKAVSQTLREFEASQVAEVMRHMLANFASGAGMGPSTEKDFTASRQDANQFEVLTTDKEAAPRWILISSSNRRDRDRQLVSRAALEKAVAIGDATQFRGPLRWWHTKEKGKVLDLGTCDFQMVRAGFLVESGTFVSPAVAAAVKKAAPLLKASLGFIHPKSEPDGAGVFHNIAIYERSLLPKGVEANAFTTLAIA